ncbi:hypothetical protein RB595_004957 [Gaeumannomyces hyphopodioides]
MDGHQRPWAGGPPQGQAQPQYIAVSPSAYTNYPEVAPNSPDSAAPQVAYDASPETVPLQHYASYKQYPASDESPTFAGHDFEDKHLANPVLNSSSDKQLAYSDYRSTAPPPAGLEPAPEMADEKPVATKKNRKMMWIIVAIAILLVIGAAIGGGVGGTMAARNKAAAEAEASQLGSNSQISTKSEPATSSTSQPATSSTSQPATSSASQSSTTSSSQAGSSSTSQPSSTSSGSSRPSPVATGKPGEVCVEGTGEANFKGLCTFSCQYGYVPAPCTCVRFGAQVQPPPATGQKGYPKIGVPDRCSYLGLCSFAWDRGYTDNLAACGSDPAGGEGCS